MIAAVSLRLGRARARCPGCPGSVSLGVDPRADRNTALLQLATEVPPAVLADLLGLHIGTAIHWANEAGGDWTNYAAIRATADMASPPTARPGALGRRRAPGRSAVESLAQTVIRSLHPLVAFLSWPEPR